jgi:hypothetical protein
VGSPEERNERKSQNTELGGNGNSSTAGEDDDFVPL